MKLTHNLSRITSFIAFLSFGILLLFAVSAALVLSFSVSFDGGQTPDQALSSFFRSLAFYFVIVLVVLGTAPFWGRRLIGFFTATSPGYWKIAGLGVWLPMLLSLVANVIAGLLFADASSWLQLGVLVSLYLLVVLLISSIYYSSELKQRQSL